MSTTPETLRDQAHHLLSALPLSRVAALLPVLAALQEEESVDPETAARIQDAFDEPGEDVSHEETNRRFGLE